MLTKEDLSFITDILDKPKGLMLAATDDTATDNNKVSGDMDIPKPVSVDQQGTMTVEDYNKCAMLMSVCQNMVQKNIIDAAKLAGIDTATALKDMNAWVTGYVKFPFPFFNFKDTQSNTYTKDDFSIDADPDFVDQIVNLKGVEGLKDAVVGALKKSEGNLLKYTSTEKDFKYFGVITSYNETEIAIRVIKFSMYMKNTDVKSLCGRVAKTKLDTKYDTFQFVGDKSLMIKMQEKMGDQMVDYFADKLLEFIKSFYDSQLKEYQQELADLLRKK